MDSYMASSLDASSRVPPEQATSARNSAASRTVVVPRIIDFLRFLIMWFVCRANRQGCCIQVHLPRGPLQNLTTCFYGVFFAAYADMISLRACNLDICNSKTSRTLHVYLDVITLFIF